MKYIIAIMLSIVVTLNQYGQDLKVGQKAPEIILKSVNGNNIRLSSLSGQMVLVDFWASWCTPCRKENPVLVKTYNKYKNSSFKNGDCFTIYSVSMDTQERAWKDAIIKDKLEWPYHVSDLQGWNSKTALTYNITQVPFCYLIDGNGIIVSINPRGERLESELKKLSKKVR